MDTSRTLQRRHFLRIALTAAALTPVAGGLASCAAGGGEPAASSGPTGAVSAENPFGVADGSTVDAVIFNGGYGTDYVTSSGGVDIAGVAFGSAEGRLVHEPTNVLADENGYVRYPDIDMASQMGQLIISQRAYQANAAVVDRAKTSYEAALQIGRG